MSSDLTDLARRVVACPRWKWMPGMLAWRTTHEGEMVRVRMMEGLDGDVELADSRKSEVQPSGRYVLPSGHATVNGWHREESLLPDLTDPATLGCLLALVREAWGDDSAYLCDFGGYDSVEWGVVSHLWEDKREAEGKTSWFACLLGDASTEAGAIVRALEAAPCQEQP